MIVSLRALIALGPRTPADEPEVRDAVRRSHSERTGDEEVATVLDVADVSRGVRQVREVDFTPERTRELPPPSPEASTARAGPPARTVHPPRSAPSLQRVAGADKHRDGLLAPSQREFKIFAALHFDPLRPEGGALANHSVTDFPGQVARRWGGVLGRSAGHKGHLETGL